MSFGMSQSKRFDFKSSIKNKIGIFTFLTYLPLGR